MGISRVLRCEAPPDGESYRVIRGGAFNSTETVATAFYRGYIRPSLPADSARVHYAATGFRCALPLGPAAP